MRMALGAPKLPGMHTHAHRNNGILRFATLVACAIAALAALPAVASAAAPGLGGTGLATSTPSVTACYWPGDAGWFTYQASGTATGAYAGTYTETGKITVAGYEGQAQQRITAAEAQFTINSPTGQVTGTKVYVPTGDAAVNTARASCGENWNGVAGAISIWPDDLRYNATITTTDGQTCTQAGPVDLRMTLNQPFINTNSFSSTFQNDVAAPIACTGGEPEPEPEPEMPTSKEDCMDGGWADYGFKNQGACIAWVNHNLP